MNIRCFPRYDTGNVPVSRSTAETGTRIDPETRTCASLPDEHSLYTVAVHTQSTAATSRTVSNLGSKLVAKSLEIAANRCDGWKSPIRES